jgi:hypothetical protein
VSRIPAYRKPLASGFSGYLLDPLTLLLHIPGHEGRFADGPDFATEFHSHYLSLVHECAHWLQLQGTSFGALIQLISHSQGRNSLGRLESMTKKKRARLIEGRILTGEPMVSGGYGRRTGDAEIDDLRENWLDHEYALRLMMDGLAPGVRIDRAAMVGFVCGVCCLGVCAQAGFQPYTDDDWAAGVFTAGSAGVFELALGNERITVRSLLEGAATVQEWLALRELQRLEVFDRRQEREAHDRLRDTLTSPGGVYGRAYRVFVQMAGFETRFAEREDVLRLFVLICDLALNPVVPPAIVPKKMRLEWGQIYPPARFHSILQSLRSPERLYKRLAPDTVVEIRSRILDMARLPAFPERVGPPWGRMRYPTFLAKQPAEVQRTLMEHQRYRFWVQARCWALREKYPWAFVSFHDVLLGARGGQEWRYARNAECRGWVQPPFRWAYKGTRASKIGMVDVDREHGTDILLAAATDYSQFELISKRGPLVLSQFPAVERAFFRRAITASYEQRFGVTAFQKW